MILVKYLKSPIHGTLRLKHYSLCLAGVIYDVIVEPPGVGTTTDERGVSRPVRLIYELDSPLFWVHFT